MIENNFNKIVNKLDEQFDNTKNKFLWGLIPLCVLEFITFLTFIFSFTPYLIFPIVLLFFELIFSIFQFLILFRIIRLIKEFNRFKFGKYIQFFNFVSLIIQGVIFLVGLIVLFGLRSGSIFYQAKYLLVGFLALGELVIAALLIWFWVSTMKTQSKIDISENSFGKYSNEHEEELLTEEAIVVEEDTIEDKK
ncbi:hypothetical protein [Mycoplasma sp. Mirounga ES2805-ORL]|uniref:hypothetical protein n=1 Tax=Mycoplasma sp. Mirounga ES2805-ORL TaxID=754514 RepID=UPI00197C884B|nr:hypothetical protein [Mycoplasma sp. Mirounga ES2805-ORL]QSF13447.1 hypothetical protein JXZ90_02095 [Mycoplasma sp. Mirounga ES2805-ORL]